VGYCVPFGWSGLFRCLGAQRPVARPAPGGGPAFFGRKPEERTPGRKRFFLPGPTFSGWGDPAGVLSFFCLACGPVSYARNGPPTGWAGWGRWFRRREGSHSAKPSPWGEGAPVRTLGRMRGRACTQPFLVEKRRSPDCRLNEVFLLLRWACRSPPHQSPSVTASPQGEASGLCRPTQKKRSKSGYADGHRNSPTTGTMRPTTPKRASGNERAIKKGGAGGIPPRLFASGLSLEKAWIPRPGPGGNPPRRG